MPTNGKLILGTDGGLLQVRDINLSTATSGWLQSELISEVQEFYVRREQIDKFLQVAVRTSENRMQFERQEGQPVTGRGHAPRRPPTNR